MSDDYIDNLEEEIKKFRTDHDNQDKYKQPWQYRSIYSVPNRFKDLDKYEFTPQVVSLGPYHHRESHLKEMETHKIRSLNNLLERSGWDLEWWLDSLEKKASKVEKLKNHYHGLDPVLWEDPRRFMKLMLLDGCFILDILHTCEPDALSARGYDDFDPIFGVDQEQRSIDQLIRRDMLLLENQLPLLLLEMIILIDSQFSKEEAFGFGSSSSKRPTELKVYVRKLIKTVFRLEGSISKYDKSVHILDMYRKSLLVKYKDPMHVVEQQSFNQLHWLINVDGRLNHKVICTIEMLQKAGTQIKPSETHSLDDITFQNDVLTLPDVELNVTTKSLFLNLIAYEKLHNSSGQGVSSYISFMSLVTSSADIQILSSLGIIRNTLGSDHSAAQVFNFLSRNATLLEMDHDTREIMTSIENYYTDYMKNKWKRRFQKWLSSLHETYFQNPWTSISVGAATILLVLTAIQTTYTVLQYYFKNNPAPAPAPAP